MHSAGGKMWTQHFTEGFERLYGWQDLTTVPLKLDPVTAVFFVQEP